MVSTEAERIIERFVAAWERADVNELLAYLAEDAVWHQMPMTPAVGKAALREAMSLWLSATAQLGAEIHTQVSDGNTVMHERTDRFLLDGKKHAAPVAAAFEIKNGLIVAWREYFDMSPFAG